MRDVVISLSVAELGMCLLFLALIAWTWKLRCEAVARDAATTDRAHAALNETMRNLADLPQALRTALEDGARGAWPDQWGGLSAVQCGEVLSYVDGLRRAAAFWCDEADRAQLEVRQ